MSNNGYRTVHVVVMSFALALVALLFPRPSTVEAATPTAQVELLGNMIAGLYQGSGANASTAIFVIHETSDFIAATPCLDLNQRGFTALCAKSQYTSDGEVNWDQLALDVGQGVKFLRSLPGVTHVVLVGWSGGGAISAYYQNVAENGVGACQGTVSLDPCSNSLAGLPPADGVVLLDSIAGLAFANMSALDASVSQPDGLNNGFNPSLYLFNPANGWNSNQLQSSTYSQQFIDRYTQAQAAREADLVNGALGLKKQIANGKTALTNDLPYPVVKDSARIFSTDTNLLSRTKGQYPLITPTSPSGTVQTVSTVRTPAAAGSLASTPQSDNAWAANDAYTVNSFLSIDAISAPNFRVTEDSVEGVDWATSNTATVANVAGISAPLLIMSMTAHYWVVFSEMYYLAATKSHSKTLAYVYGATHGFTPCTVCPSMPLGPYGDTENETFNYVANWLETHF